MNEFLQIQTLMAHAVTPAASEKVAAQWPYSYNLNKVTAAYPGYSHGAYANDDQLQLVGRDRSASLNLSYAWQPGG
jgi:hypothetical protein